MMQLVEVVVGTSTSEEIVAHAMTFTRQIDRLPLPVSSTPGFLVNRILMPYLMEAVVLESEGVPATTIDKAAVDFGMPMGPVELADTVGLDICLHVVENLAEHFDAEIPERLRKLVAAGKLGKKSGQGFYQFKKGKAVKPKASASKEEIKDVTDRLMLRMLNEAMSCLREQVVSSDSLLDAGMIFGTGFAPFRGGPMHYIDATGADKLKQTLIGLEQQQGNRFTPDPAWNSPTGGDKA
jgi:3-hydroxyacyl-CoA dehydrogenase/enoyl-CoA hydratase/3-hydroxybutyryl-CoA epimerase